MKNLSLGLNVLLLMAVAVLYYLHFSNNSADTKVIPAIEIESDSLALSVIEDVNKIESNIGAETVIKTFTTPINSYPISHAFSVEEFFPTENEWPSGPGLRNRSIATITVSYLDRSTLSSPSQITNIYLNNCGN